MAKAQTASTEAEATLQEIVVTAERREESLLRVPVAVSAIAGDQLAEQHIAHLGELSAQIPNVEINSPRGNSLTDVVIRGVGIANDFTLNQASPVGVYLDDSYMASRTFSGAQAYDLERVEVLRGPQGTLFGRNTTGGLLNFITRRPELGDDNGRIEAGYGNFDDIRVQGAFEKTIAPGSLGVRVAGTYHRHDGYFDNLSSGQPDADDLETRAGRLELRWKPSGDVDLTLRTYAQRDDNRQWNVRVKLVGAAEEIPPGKFNVNLTPGRFRTSSAGTQFKAVVDLGKGWALTNLGAYDRGKLTLTNVDLDGRPGGPTSFGYTVQSQSTRFNQFNEELRLNYEGAQVKAVIGAYYGEDRVRDNVRYDVFTGVSLSPVFRYDQKRESKALFAQLDYSLTDQFTLTGGVRLTRDQNAYRKGHADVYLPGQVPGGVLNTLPGAFTPACPTFSCPAAELPDRMGKDDAVTGRVAVRYAFSDGQILYASYSRGYRSGAFNGNAYLTVAQLSYVEPETVDAYEIGGKGRFLDGRLHLAAAAFYNVYRDQQINFLRAETTALGTFPVNILGNVPKAITKGLELEGDVLLTDGFQLHAALGLLDASYSGGARVASLDLSGNRLPYAPKLSGTIGANWRLGDVGGGTISFAPTVVYSSAYFFDPTANANVRTDGFTRVNAAVSWTRGDLSARLWSNNLFNQKYNVYGLDLSANTGNYYYSASAPRTYGVTISREF